MIAFIKGKVYAYDHDSVILDHDGIGFRIYMPNTMSLVLHEEILVYTYQHYREDGQELYGFPSLEEHDLFLKLISVKGIGPKSAMNMLSKADANDIVKAIENEDVAALKALPGIGAKAANQIILDLKGKLVQETQDDVNPSLNDAMEALKALGYKQSEINRIVKQLKKEELTTDGYIRKALALLSIK